MAGQKPTAGAVLVHSYSNWSVRHTMADSWLWWARYSHKVRENVLNCRSAQFWIFILAFVTSYPNRQHSLTVIPDQYVAIFYRGQKFPDCHCKSRKRRQVKSLALEPVTLAHSTPNHSVSKAHVKQIMKPSSNVVETHAYGRCLFAFGRCPVL